MIKLCCCSGAHTDYSRLVGIAGAPRECIDCGMPEPSMTDPAPDAFGKFERGDLIIRWLPDGSVNLVDVGEPIAAWRVYT